MEQAQGRGKLRERGSGSEIVTSSMRQMRAEREMPAARQSAETPALAARPQLRTRTPVPSAHRSTCVASVRHSSRGKCTLRRGTRITL